MPYAYLALIIGWAASVAGAGWWSYGHGIETQTGRQAAAVAEQQVQITALEHKAAARVVVVQGKQRLIAQEVQHEIEVRTVYRECEHSTEQLQRINTALGADGAEPAGGSKLPAADAADKPIIRRDDGKAD